ncbi:hypothetical protein [Longimicrobium sp.]|jgi:hypothetical protein|uniref:hypothetical protein n=1 Tax=Longimicrobium sp. TaxID=2029185 RepID=UPI002ED79384
MKKLRLDLDTLNVQSFATGAGSAGGTVDAHIGGNMLQPSGTSLEPDTSKINSCYFDTCYETCDWSTQSTG